MKSDEELLRIFEDARKRVTEGEKYRHYKGGQYKVLHLALIEESLEPCVVYRAEYGENLVFTRPLSDWLGKADAAHGTVSRFSLIE